MNRYGDLLIIGGGPAGIIGICVYLHKYPNKQIIWIDKCFNVGKLSQYPDVYANTPFIKMVKFLEIIYTLLNKKYNNTLCPDVNNNYFKLGCLCNEFKNRVANFM